MAITSAADQRLPSRPFCRMPYLFLLPLKPTQHLQARLQVRDQITHLHAHTDIHNTEKQFYVY